MGTGNLNVGGTPAVDQYPVQGAVKILHSLHATETRMNYILTGHMARLQNLPLLMEVLVVSSGLGVGREKITVQNYE